MMTIHNAVKMMCASILSKSILLISLSVIALPAQAVCINPLITPIECQFKFETTQLSLNQPTIEWAKDDRVREAISRGRNFIENYYNSVKLTGDLNIRWMAAPVAADIALIEATEIANTAITLASDPFSLMRWHPQTIAQCFALATAVNLASDADRECAFDIDDLLINADDLLELDEIRQQVEDILLNPDIEIGEQWSNSVDEIRAIRDTLLSPDRLARNLNANQLTEIWTTRFPSLDAMLTNGPRSLIEQREAARSQVDSRRNTIRDHMMATRQSGIDMRTNDREEMRNIIAASQANLGRMQATETDNLIGIQDVANYRALIEEMMNMTTLQLQDLSDAQEKRTRQQATAITLSEPIPDHEVIRGNSVVFRQ